MDGWPGQIVSLRFSTPGGRSLFLCRGSAAFANLLFFHRLRPVHNPFRAAVISSGSNPVYAKQKLSPLRSRGCLFLCLVLAFLAACPRPSRADSLEDAARALARKLCSAPRQQTVRINWQDSPELSGSFPDSFKKSFLLQLSACGIGTGNNSNSPRLVVSIQSTASKLLLVANLVDSLGSVEIRMAEIRRETLSISNEPSRVPRLQKDLLWQQERPVESATEWQNPSTQERFLFLLSEGFFVRLHSQNEIWTQVDSTELPKMDRRSRLRGGTFVFSDKEAKLQLLSNLKLCDFEPEGPLRFTCVDTNFGGKAVLLSSICGEPPRSIRTDTGDYTQRDHIILSGQEVAGVELPAEDAASRSLEMPGPVLDIANTPDSKAVTAVVRNLSTGNYEVYQITLGCAN